jgi:hypothetical protein
MKTLLYILASATILSITSSKAICQSTPDTATEVLNTNTLPQNKEATQATSSWHNNGYAYCKHFIADSDNANGTEWYKIATIRSTGNLGKHVCAFTIYSTVSPHYGVYYASFFLNLRRGGDANEMYGHFYCTDWNKDKLSNFSPNDFCVTYTGSSHEEVTTTIWKKASNRAEDFFIFGAEFVAEAATFTFAENSYRGTKEYMTHKPTVADGFDFVIDVEDKSRKKPRK